MTNWRNDNVSDEELSAFWKRFKYPADWTKEIKSARDVQILFSYGYEFEADYKDLRGFLCPYYGYAIDAKDVKTGKTYEYVADDLDEFGRDAMFGPYPLADVIGKWKIGWHA
jgi:hypothetical protein